MALLAEDAPWAGAASLVFLLLFHGFAWLSLFLLVFLGFQSLWFSTISLVFLGFQSLWFSTSGSLDSSLTVQTFWSVLKGLSKVPLKDFELKHSIFCLAS